MEIMEDQSWERGRVGPGGQQLGGLDDHVFIVDDDESFCRSLKVLLATYGFKVRTFKSYEKFRRAIPTRTPGSVVLDIHLPGMDGWEGQQDMYQSGSDRSVILISADRSSGIRERALGTGAMGFLQKPIQGQDLVEMIQMSSILKETKMPRYWFF